MDKKWFRRAALIMGGALVLGAAGCDDDDSKEYTVNTQDKWIGAACECNGSGCAIIGIPIPNGKPITGCDNVPAVAGAENVCLRTIEGAATITAPGTYFPQGYCSLAAVECTVSELCSLGAAFGDYETMTKCPAGSAMLIGEFDYYLMDPDHQRAPAHFRQKTCAKLCNSDADCNTAGDMHCIERRNVKFCYNEKNFEAPGEPSEVKVFE